MTKMKAKTVNQPNSKLICVISVCKACGKAVLYKYYKGYTWSYPPSGVGLPVSSGVYGGVVSGRWTRKPDIEWCPCDSDEPRHICKVEEDAVPGLEEACEKCEYKYICASSRIELVYEGEK